MANGITFRLPGDPQERFKPFEANVPDVQPLTMGDLYSPQGQLPDQREKTFGEYFQEAMGMVPDVGSLLPWKRERQRAAMAMQLAPHLMDRDVQRQALQVRQQQEERQATQAFLKDVWDATSRFEPENQVSAIKEIGKRYGVKDISNIVIKQLVEDAQVYPTEMADKVQRLGLTRQAVRSLLNDPVKFAQFRKEYADTEKQYAPTREILFVTKAAKSFGIDWKPGQPVPAEVADRALQMEHEWNERNRIPLGDEPRVFYEELKRTGSVQSAQEATIAYTTRKAGGRGYGGRGGALGAEFTPKEQLPQPPGFQPRGAAPGPGPISQGPQVAPGKPAIQERSELTSIGGKAGDVAEQLARFNIVRGYVDQIDRLSKPLITAQKAPESWWQSAKIAGGRVTNYDQLAKYYNSQVEAFLGQLSRTVGAQVGVLTQLDVDAMRNLLPTPGDTMAQREGKIGSLKAILRLNQEAHKARLTAGGDLPEEAFQRYRDAIDAQIAKIEKAAGMRESPKGGGSASDYLKRKGFLK